VHYFGGQEQMEGNTLSTAIQQITSVIVRLIGMMVLFVGLYVGLKVILEAWGLYQRPERIESFAAAIERGSNIDQIFSATVQRISTEVSDDVVIPSDGVPTESMNPANEDSARPPTSGSDKSLRLSYFAAWLIAMMLFLIIGSLAMSAISTGGRLALYDTDMRKFSRQLVRDFSRIKKAA
jgi:disulfide bond formation protein DsbB